MQDFFDILLVLSFAITLTLVPWGIYVLLRMIFRKLFGRDVPRGSVQSLSITFVLSGSEYGADQERRSIQRFARKLEAKLKVGTVGEYDGDEFGGGEARLFFFGPSADDLWELIEEDVRNHSPYKALSVLLIYGKRPEDRVMIVISEAEPQR